jgi:hypothetical protein
MSEWATRRWHVPRLCHLQCMAILYYDNTTTCLFLMAVPMYTKAVSAMRLTSWQRARISEAICRNGGQDSEPASRTKGRP